MKQKVVKISFLNSNKTYFFSNNNLDLEAGESVIVESDRGIQFGTVNSKIFELDENKIMKPLKKVIRKLSTI